MGSVVVDVCQALENVDIQNIDLALAWVAWKEEVAKRDVQITQLIREKVKLRNQLTKAEADLKLEEARTKGRIGL